MSAGPLGLGMHLETSGPEHNISEQNHGVSTPGRNDDSDSGRLWLRTDGLDPAALLTAAVWVIWAVAVTVMAFRTMHAAPDYSDTLRLVNDFIIPLESANGADRFSLFVAEYQPLGHAHILTRFSLLWSGSGWGGLYDFSIPGNIGRIAYLGMLAGVPAFIGTVGRREGARYPWLAALLVLLVLIRVDGAAIYLNNFLAFEYVYLALAMAYVAVLAGYLTGRIRMHWALMLGVVLALIGDAPGATALLAGAGVAMWVAVRTRRFDRRLVVPIVPIATSFVVAVALSPWSDASLLAGGRSELVRLGPWLARGVAQGVINLNKASSWFGWSGSRTVLIATLAMLIFGIIVVQLIRSDPSKTGHVFAVGLIAFGLIAMLGAFATRSADPGAIFALRYLRLATPIIAGMVALLVLRLKADPRSIKTIGITGAVSIVFIGRLVVGGPDIRPLIDHFHNYETWFARYEPGTFDELSPEMEQFFRFQFWTQYGPDDGIVTRVLDWQADHVRFETR